MTDKKIDWKELLILTGLFTAILILWRMPILMWIIYPVKIFVVLLHEISHGIAAVITGGQVVKIELSHLQGGAAWSRGGIRLFVLPAGYIGSMIWGGFILLISSKTKLDKVLSAFLGGIVLIVTIILIRPIISFGFLFGLLFGAAMLCLGIFVPRKINDLVLKFIGLTSILYAVLDIGSDLILRQIPGSDASEMAKITFIPGIVWGIIWMITSLIAGFIFLKIAVTKRKSDEEF